ncbi:MFS family permease [Rhodopseudomonas julia]|uniref:MFS family permease n=1 Tax=Rhodopseudomonas julia TaxID=200617 RepID=A0ABU0C9P9_9BRAD|nr:MFS transporter [Rhodopseudomonas julia]MDQ0327255.1 MFS family permease [Rhodopseudomonas julia]
MSLSTALGGRLAALGLTRGAIAAISTMIAVGTAISLLSPLLALTLSGRGVSERTIGFLVATLALSALFATPYAPRIAHRFGTARTISYLLPAAACLIPFAWYVTALPILFVLLFVYGMCVSICFALSEFWINAVTPHHRRGIVMGIYATCLSIGFAFGPVLISITGLSSPLPFFLGSGLFVIAAIPTWLARDVSPDFSEKPSGSFFSFIFAVPIATFGVLVFAMAESSGFAFLPLWGQHLGYAPAIFPLLASAMTLGNVVFQIPLGIIADKIDKRLILLVCGLVGCLGMVIASAATTDWLTLAAVLFLWGGASAGLYTVGLAHLAARFSGGDLASANSAFVFCYALGMLIGPVMVGDAMNRMPTAGFPISIGAAFGAYCIIAAARLVRSRTETP